MQKFINEQIESEKNNNNLKKDDSIVNNLQTKFTNLVMY